ncbi:zinc finger protein 91-like [Contarinia nasturtii]|uniref:zinc finger protein 91-like n=1 Tax=Contarinia nasturtii TaxID=265458 RepID=UPI0012D374BB|nr:zinc finger protein 91-like [Contarinia nasturtii]
MAFQCDGLTFNAEFKQYFLRSTNKQIKDTYDQFEISSMLRNQVDVDSYGSIKNFDFNGFRKEMNDLTNLIDSSSEEGLDEGELESSETASDIQYVGNDMPPEFYGDAQFVYDESTDEVRNSNNRNCQGDEFEISIEDEDSVEDEEKMEVDRFMKKHKVAHTDEIPFHCPGCFTGFSQEVDQKAHVFMCKTRRYECHICKKFSTVGKSHLKGHIRKHSGEKPFRCHICMKRFTEKRSLKRHLNTLHTSFEPKMLSWSDEMSEMLAAFQRQAKYSLINIEMAFVRDGLILNDEFKQYFLRASNNCIEETYDQFKINTALRNKNYARADASSLTNNELPMMSSIYTPRYDMTNIKQELNDPVEIIDSSDEEGQADNQVLMEPSTMKSIVQYGDHGIPPELNDLVQLNNDFGYTDEVPNMMLNGIKSHYQHVTLNTGRNVADGTKTKNVTKRSTKRQNAESSSTLEEIGHKKSNQLKKRSNCKLCGHSCDRRNFKRHMRTHTGEKPYRCEICRKEFTQLSNKERHKMTHTDEIPFHCRGCFSGFSQKTDKEAHEKVCKSRRYECHICKKYVTVNKNTFKKHMRKHTSEKPFRCKICMKGFTQKDNLKMHLDTIHTRINP